MRLPLRLQAPHTHLLGSHGLKHLLQLDSQLLHVVHEDTRLQTEEQTFTPDVPTAGLFTRRQQVQTYDLLFVDVRRKTLGENGAVLQQNFVDGLERRRTNYFKLRRPSENICSGVDSSYLREAATVLSQDVWVGTLQLPDDLKALVELGEDVDHGAGEQSVLRRLLELRAERNLQALPIRRPLQAQQPPPSLLRLFCLSPGLRA